MVYLHTFNLFPTQPIMKSLIVFIVAGLALFACTEIVFEDPQPPGARALESIPAEIQGKYSFVVLNEETLLEIGKDYLTKEDERVYLSDSLIITKLGNRYVVNTLIDKGEGKAGKWQVYVLEDKGCGFVKATTFIINSDTYVEPFNTTYKGTMLGEGQEKTIIVKTTAEQFNTILADDSVTVSIILERLSN